ncbi:hypothetical protein M9H77_28850 [Catharanthus roseus]|uniref:Uncharacterized protein n=1 Tax=Catharanthus roseus TaxID=4058 RepID=A0ACC0AGJ0_CATRO|nr:hypothetical protein M9H77_28850 [Catharanthus roseus]
MKSLIQFNLLFIDTHLKSSLTRYDEFVLIKHFLNDDKHHQTLLSLDIDDGSSSVLVPDLEIHYFIDESLEIKPFNYDFSKHMSSCNGIICLFYQGNFILFNPVTREIRIFPPHPLCPEGFSCFNVGWGFKFDTATDDYEIVIISGL